MKTVFYILNEARFKIHIDKAVNLEVRAFINGAIFEIFNEAIVITDSIKRAIKDT